MAQPIFVEPTWGSSISKGLQGGFDSIINALSQRKKQSLLDQQLQMKQQEADAEFFMNTGVDRSTFFQGAELARRQQEQQSAGLPEQMYTNPQALEQKSALIDQYNELRGTIQGGLKAKNQKLQDDARVSRGNANLMDLITGVNTNPADQYPEAPGPWRAGTTAPAAPKGKLLEPTLETLPDGSQAIRTVSKSGVRLTPYKPEKGTVEAVQGTTAALNSAGNIDAYFDSLEESKHPRLAQVSTPFHLRDFAFPKVAQTESALFTTFQFSMGGKALTDIERDIIFALGKNPSYGPSERMAARIEMRKYLVNKIRSYADANLLGADKENKLKQVRELESRWGINPGQREKLGVRAAQLEKLGLNDDQIHEIMDGEGYK